MGGVVGVVCLGGFTGSLAFSVYLNRGTLPNSSAMRPSVNRRCITRFTVLRSLPTFSLISACSARARKIVAKAKGIQRRIALEDLKGIRKGVSTRRSQRSRLHSWGFYQLRQFIEYKARLEGVQVVAVPPRGTSRARSSGSVDRLYGVVVFVSLGDAVVA